MGKIWTGKLKRLDDNRWLISKTYKSGMNTDGIIYINEHMIPQVIADNALEQVANVAHLPGIVGRSIAMPDIHSGYGFPIGGVAAFETEYGIVSPGGVGYDINCGVRLLRTSLNAKQVKPKIRELIEQIYCDVPVGTGEGGIMPVQQADVPNLLKNGARWAVENGFGWAEDIEMTEEQGCLSFAEPSRVSEKAVKRGLPQVGSLGSGNHFLEIQVVDKIFNPGAAEAFGIEEEGQICVMLHTGSRGFGHQVCTDFIDAMQVVAIKYDIELPDRQLACAPINSEEGQEYLGAMGCAANFAWVNRQVIAHTIRKAFAKVFDAKPEALDFYQIYDLAHNIAKFETFDVKGVSQRLLVHRKGATRAYPANHPDVPKRYLSVGQPVLIPGDMGRCSYLMVGTERAMKDTFGSTCHGAGRLMSRNAALKMGQGTDIVKQMDGEGIFVKAQSRKLLAEEASYAYKDVEDVVAVAIGAGISKPVCRLKPLGVIKG